MTDASELKHDNPSFEQRLDELETVVADLESGDLCLDDMLRRYEHGMKLIAACQQRLAEAELRVTEIAAERTDDEDDMQSIPF